MTSKQLDDIQVWTDEFIKDTKKTGEKVVFDIICGDFNFDNMSPGKIVYFIGVFFWEGDEGARTSLCISHRQ